MQSALEQEIRLLIVRLREWMRARDRAVLFGALLCCVPFLPVTFVGLVVTLGNLLLVRLGKLPRAELPVLCVALGVVVFYVVLWWALFSIVAASGLWLGVARFWRGVWELMLWFRPRGFGLDV